MNNKKLKDGLGVGGKGRLTDAFIDKTIMVPLFEITLETWQK